MKSIGVGHAARGLAAALVLVPGAAWAQQSSTWLANPGTANFNTGANWSPAAVPDSGGTASFGASTRTTINMNGPGTGTLQFNAGAPAYVFNRSFAFSFFTLDGAGIVNNSSNAPIFNLTSTFMEFDNSASAGNAIINMDGAALTFTGTTTAANAAITNGGGGTLSFTDTSTAGNATIITNNGSLTQFSSDASGGTARLITNAGGILRLSGLNSGMTAGSIEGAGNIELGASQLTVGSNNLSTTVSGVISGAGGSLIKTGTGTLNLTGVNTYDGPTTISGGTLAVNGSITSNVTVGSAGTLGGNGTITGSVLNGGAIAPGNSIGTITINGSLTQSVGGTYQAEINGSGQSDRINVTGAPGTATLGGTVNVLPVQGSYARSTTYTILNATGGITGTYAAVTLNNFAFLFPSLSYDANNVYLTVNAQFARGALTLNQRNVGAVLDQAFPTASGAFANVLGAIAGLSSTQGPIALDAISGQQYSGFGTANVLSSLAFMNVLGQQMALARGGSGGGTRVALAEACDVACDGPQPGPWSLWGSALGGTGSLAGNGNSSTLTYNLGGFATGVDYRFDPRFLVGVGLGYSSGNQWVNNFSSRGTSDSYNVAAYASFTQSAFYLDALAGYGYNDNQMTRQIAIPGVTAVNAQGRTSANQFTGQAEAGYKVGVYAPAAASLTPFARFQTAAVGQNAFNESGANVLSLSVAQQNTTSVRTVLGAELSGGLDMGWRDKLALQLRLGWAHEYADTTRPVSASFAGAPGIGFTVYGATQQRDAAVIGLALNTAIADATQIYLRYDGELGTGTDNHVLSAGLRMSW